MGSNLKISVNAVLTSLWKSSDLSIPEIGLRSGSKIYDKTLWRWFSNGKKWSRTEAIPFLSLVERDLGLTENSLWDSLAGTIDNVDKRIVAFAASQFHHPNLAHLRKTTRLLGDQPEINGWTFIGQVPPLFALPGRPLRKLLKAVASLHAVPRHAATAMISFWRRCSNQYIGACEEPITGHVSGSRLRVC